VEGGEVGWRVGCWHLLKGGRRVGTGGSASPTEALALSSQHHVHGRSTEFMNFQHGLRSYNV